MLPVHGFVLAGGKSSRMGADKALLEFRGRPMVEIAVEKLRNFCVTVSIAGNRQDLDAFAPVVREMRLDAGPAAGIEAGLEASEQKWAVFIPVDVPLVPAGLLRRWVEESLAVENGGFWGSYLVLEGRPQPAFCLLRREALGVIVRELEGGERRLSKIFFALNAEFGEGSVVKQDVARFAPRAESAKHTMEYWFSNVNTRQELAEAEAWGNICVPKKGSEASNEFILE
ncbi:MAG: molybdenum cofactor guanylyltransferase [Acidobacteriota bacterium]|nr:molybdenum cofactor guanylyltransferase [Acidobacteriota bacterium]